MITASAGARDRIEQVEQPEQGSGEANGSGAERQSPGQAAHEAKPGTSTKTVTSAAGPSRRPQGQRQEQADARGGSSAARAAPVGPPLQRALMPIVGLVGQSIPATNLQVVSARIGPMVYGIGPADVGGRTRGVQDQSSICRWKLASIGLGVGAGLRQNGFEITSPPRKRVPTAAQRDAVTDRVLKK